MKTDTKQKLEDFAKRLQNNGFQVIVSRTHPFEWLYFEKHGKLGTVSPDYFWGFTFASVNKPSHKHGTGYQIADRAELSIKNAEACFAGEGWGSAGEKYSGAEEFIQNNAWAEYYILPKD